MHSHKPHATRVAYKSKFLGLHTFNTRTLPSRILYAYDMLGRQDLTFSARPVATGTAAHP